MPEYDGAYDGQVAGEFGVRTAGRQSGNGADLGVRSERTPRSPNGPLRDAPSSSR